MGFGCREAGTGGVVFPATGETNIRRNPQRDIVDSQGAYYPIDVQGRVVIPRYRHGDDSSVVTTANGFTGDVVWIGGAKIKVLSRANKIKITFDSTASDESPWDSSGEGDDHDTKEKCDDPVGGGGVRSGTEGGTSGEGGPQFPSYNGGVPARDGQTAHDGGVGPCC